jgi:hypothetical protein
LRSFSPWPNGADHDHGGKDLGIMVNVYHSGTAALALALQGLFRRVDLRQLVGLEVVVGGLARRVSAKPVDRNQP